MDKIPKEILDQIFHYLPLNEIIQFRRVCKIFRDTIDHQMKFKEISIFVGQSPFYETLFYSKQAIDLNRSLSTKSLNFLNENYFKIKFKNIQRCLLFVNSNLKLSIKIEELNFYENLEHLEIHYIYSLEGSLKLDKLKILSIDTILKCEFNADCDQLIALNLNGEANVKLKKPETLLYLECPTILKNFEQFINLTTFVCYKLTELDMNCLIDLPNLKELQLYSIKKKEYLINLLEEKQNQNRFDLKIIFGGINIENDELFQNLCSTFQYLFSDLEIWTTNFLTSRLLRFYTRNYLELDSTLPFIEYLEIDNFEVSNNILIKLVNLKTLYINNQFINNDKFNLLIRTCKKLKYIQFFNLVLDQVQFDQMPIYLSNLKHLEFKKCRLDHFNFVSEFKNLEFFGSNQELKVIELKRMILNCKLLKTIKSNYEDKTFFINLIEFKVRYLNEIYQFDSSEQLIEHIEACKSVNEFFRKLIK